METPSSKIMGLALAKLDKLVTDTETRDWIKALVDAISELEAESSSHVPTPPSKTKWAWSKAEDQYLREARKMKLPYAEIAKKLGRTESACRQHALSLGLVARRGKGKKS